MMIGILGLLFAVLIINEVRFRRRVRSLAVPCNQQNSPKWRLFSI